MLGNLKNENIAPHIGKMCLLVCADGSCDAVLDSADEIPNARHPYAPPGKRTPFTLIFRGNPDCWLGDGTYTIRIPGINEIPGVYMNRIMNIRPEPASVFQAAFN